MKVLLSKISILLVVAVPVVYGLYRLLDWAGRPNASAAYIADNREVDGWNYLGSVYDGYSHGSLKVFWTVNEKTGDRVYVVSGPSRGGIFVVSAGK